MSHTEGRLEVVTECPGECCWHIQRVGNTDEFQRITSLEMREEDARRLVACWNYCEGVPTHEIENSESDGDRLRGVYAAKVYAEKERDELVEALRKFNHDVLEEFAYAPNPGEIEAILAKYPEQS